MINPVRLKQYERSYVNVSEGSSKPGWGNPGEVPAMKEDERGRKKERKRAITYGAVQEMQTASSPYGSDQEGAGRKSRGPTDKSMSLFYH
ncbi:unnamed protein product [Pleuronectes platessa]|uniref:Uncharacterized protein n=1 Tax=Pleuronectes platessa TaxID=8262 RepID=A0A9N7Z027_PLEPL|nr:unnamed protein product [Pleuronectes platessa]